MKIHYEPHPVSEKRKAELRAQGVRIVDARFAPKSGPADLLSREGVARMKRADLLECLSVHGIDGPKGSVAELREMLLKIMFVDA